MTEEEVREFEEKVCPTCGSCSGMYTANSMNCLAEALGMALPGNGTIPAVYAARTQLAKHSWLEIVFMIPFMTPPYIASMGWILFMQKKGLFQQLFPATGAWSERFFCFGGLVLVMSLHVFPFMLTMLKNAMLNIPSSLEEAGAVFGAEFPARMFSSASS